MGDQDTTETTRLRTPQSNSDYNSIGNDTDNVDVTFRDDKPRSSGLFKLCRTNGYAIYVLALLVLAYLLNQLDRYILAIVTSQMGREIGYGDLKCMKNSSFSDTDFIGTACNATTEMGCSQIINSDGLQVCSWEYDGQGFQYQLLAGAIFIVIYTFCGIPLGFAADYYNRVILLSVCCCLWSVATILCGAAQEYWQLALLRFVQGAAEAGCTPFAASLIADYFSEDLRGSALGIYNWGIYFGYSMSYAFGNFITEINILGQGWRWAWYISGIPGVVLAVVMVFSVKEPERRVKAADKNKATIQDLIKREGMSVCDKIGAVVKPLCKISLLMLVIASSIRNAAGYVWAYNTQLFYEGIGQTPKEIGTWMSWIPLVGGSIGVVTGGFISDRLVKKRGLTARILVIVVSQFLAAPFAAGALLAPAPFCYISLIPTYIIGEMWIGVSMVVILELVSPALRTVAVAVYLFIISNVAGNIPLLVPYLQTAFLSLGITSVQALRALLLILYPGEYVLGAILYLIALPALKYDLKKMKDDEAVLVDNTDEEGARN